MAINTRPKGETVTTHVEFPQEMADIILNDWHRFIRGGLREVDFTPWLNFFFHFIGLLDSYRPKRLDLIWSFHFDESLKNTLTFWDDLLALKRPLTFREPSLDQLLVAVQDDLIEILVPLKAEAQQILEERAWSIAKDRWDLAREDLLTNQPDLTVAQQNDRLPEFRDLIDEDEADTVLTELVRLRLEKAAARVTKPIEKQINSATPVFQPALWQLVEATARSRSEVQGDTAVGVKFSSMTMQTRRQRRSTSNDGKVNNETSSTS
jgi:hypothetical protein